MENLWRDDEAAGLAGLDLLVHRGELSATVTDGITYYRE